MPRWPPEVLEHILDSTGDEEIFGRVPSPRLSSVSLVCKYCRPVAQSLLFKKLDFPVSKPLSRIVTLHPRTYNEARVIGENYRDGVPVIMNLSEMSDGDAKRLVDFAAGLIFGVRGSIDRVTSKVFLLSPPDVTVSAEEKQRIAEGGFFNQS